MTLRLMQAGLLLLLSACGRAPSAEAVAARPFTVSEVAKFDAPWAMSFLPGSGVRMTSAALVTEKNGKLWLVDVRTGHKQAVTGVPAVHVEGQGGLAEVVAHPDFAGNQRVYLSFPEAGPNDTSGAVVGYGQLILGQGPPRLDGFRIIWRQMPKVSGGAHYSERIAFAPDGTLFITSGERFQFAPAQDLNVNLGKVVHLTAEGAPAPGNPWASRGGIAATLWTYGHRNLLGIAFAPDGRLWEAEMGPMGGDEVNLIVRGRNYGWPRASNGSNYDRTDIPDHRPGDGFEAPKVWWNPSISPGSLLIYTGALFPQWKGDALIGALSGEALIRVDINGDQARKADQWPMGARIRAVDQGPRGEVYLLEDGDGGRLLRLEPKR
ncbi:MAG: PQQ-dependent sugar dehydrogenase [Sphingomicrobium sp.]